MSTAYFTRRILYGRAAIDYAMLAIVRDAFRYLLRVNPKHAASLFARRPAGSQWGVVPKTPEAWAALDWEEVDPKTLPPGTTLPGCRYLRTTHPLLLQDAVDWVGLSTDMDPEKIFFIPAVPSDTHGPSLGTSEPIQPKPATEAWLILGPASKDDGTLVPWTAFPGRMAAPVPMTATSKERLDLKGTPFAVKYYSKETLELCS